MVNCEGVGDSSETPGARAPGRLTSRRINIAAPRVCGVGICCPKFYQGFPPRGGIVQVGLHP